MPLSQKERQQINTLVARFEANTGVQAVAAITAKADAYPEIPWKAYAIGSALGAFATVLDPLYKSSWTSANSMAMDAMIILGTGAVLAMVAAFIAPFGRLFLDSLRAQKEALQYAQTMFLERELFGTANRRAVLIVMCRFERTAVVLADTGLAQYAAPAALNDIGLAAGEPLRRGEAVAAFELALDRVGSLLQATGFEPMAPLTNELEDDVMTERGA